MTTQRDASGQNRFTPASSGFNVDIFGLAAPAQIGGSTVTRGPARFTVQQISRDDPDLFYWKVELYSLTGGLNLQRGRFDQAHDRLAGPSTAAADQLEPVPEGLILPQLTTALTDSSLSTLSNVLGGHSANIFSRLVIGVGSAQNHLLYSETTATNPALTALTYNPGSVITAMGPMVINSSTPRLAIFFTGAVGDVLDDLTPTINGTHFSNQLNDTRGFIQTPINNQTILFMVATSGAGDQFAIKTLSASSAINTVPTTALLNVPANGYAVGMLSLGGGPVRAFWVWGEARTGATSVLQLTERGHIVSTNLQGTDPQELTVGLPYIYYATIANGGIAASNGDNIRWHNGRVLKDLGIFRDRQPDSNVAYKVAGLRGDGSELIAEINQIAAPGGTGNTNRWLEVYDFNLDTWKPISGTYTPGSTGIRTLGFAGGLALSETTRNVHLLTLDKIFYRMLRPPLGTSPYSLRKILGATAGSGVTFEPSGTATWPAFQIPGLENWPLVVRRISGSPDVDAGGDGQSGGTPATVKVSIPGTSFASGNAPAIFKTGYQTGVNYGRGYQMFSSQDNSIVYELQPSVLITREVGGADPAQFTCQALPLYIEGTARRPPTNVIYQGFSAPDNRG